MDRKNKYLINQETMALVPYFDENGNACTVAKETTGSYKLKGAPKKHLESSCEFYGNTFDGSRKAAGILLQSKQMLPLSVSYALGIIAFPTRSHEDVMVTYLFLNHIEHAEAGPENACRLIFSNEEEMFLEEVYSSIRPKLQRTTMLKWILDKRNKPGE
ncbi:competence protein ComK [Bacillus marinisedimentorum]|uniref:competence protein ComK n=1 Tax=Bacillus marinisedimentorum TaxID=1821260 RepID=UPI0007E06CAA|nr:competence protein ComK [Bacillus marinisedimentorum]